MNRWVPRTLDTLVLSCLEKDPARRGADANALAADLERVRLGERVRARAPSRTMRWLRAARRRPLAATALVAVPVLTLVAFLTQQNALLDARARALSDASWSSTVAKRNPVAEAVFAAEAFGRSPDTSTRSRLFRSLADLRQIGEVRIGGQLSMSLESPDGRRLLCAVRPSDRPLRQRLEPSEFDGPWDEVLLSPGRHAAWSPDGTRYATILGRSPRLGWRETESKIFLSSRPDPIPHDAGFFHRGHLELPAHVLEFDVENRLFVADMAGCVSVFGLTVNGCSNGNKIGSARASSRCSCSTPANAS